MVKYFYIMLVSSVLSVFQDSEVACVWLLLFYVVDLVHTITWKC